MQSKETVQQPLSPLEIVESKSGSIPSGGFFKYEVFANGDVRALCQTCKETIDEPAERAEKFMKVPRWYEQYKCYECWKAEQKGESPAPVDEKREYFEKKDQKTQNRIAFAQAVNLATETARMFYFGVVKPQLLTGVKDSEHRENIMREIEQWVPYFLGILAKPGADDKSTH